VEPSTPAILKPTRKFGCKEIIDGEIAIADSLQHYPTTTVAIDLQQLSRGDRVAATIRSKLWELDRSEIDRTHLAQEISLLTQAMLDFPEVLRLKLVPLLASRFPDAVFYRKTSEKVVALTIDDIPTPEDRDGDSTRKILEAIARHNESIDRSEEQVRATFFAISSHLSDGSDILTDILAAGHELGNHGLADVSAAALTTDEFQRHLFAAHEQLVGVGGRSLRWYRPGRGLYTRKMVALLQTLSDRYGYVPKFALASMIPLDTFPYSSASEFTAAYISKFVFPGSILVLHGGSQLRSENTARVLTTVLAKLRTQGYRVVTLSELMNNSEISDRLGSIARETQQVEDIEPLAE
jgi:peptidoglycan/xylan/chitin deacetylase (PgdA/CDA1 family)